MKKYLSFFFPAFFIIHLMPKATARFLLSGFHHLMLALLVTLPSFTGKPFAICNMQISKFKEPFYDGRPGDHSPDKKTWKV